MTFEATSDFLFVSAGTAMLLHVVLCGIARRGLRRTDNLEVDEALFAVPNRSLGAPDLIRLLRLRYFLPFRALPDSANQLDPWIRATLLAARVSGLYFACAVLGFIAVAFVEAGT